jgi:hypothetical protein
MSSTTTSRSASIAAPSSPKKGTNLSKAWQAIKAHHDEMNAAYAAYYSPGSSRAGSLANSRANSTQSSPRHSVEEPRHEDAAAAPKNPTNFTKSWKALKNRAVEHHRSVNAAYRAAYGAGF